MLNIILFSVSLLVLAAAAIFLAKGHTKEHTKEKEFKIDMNEKIFNTKYDEITYLYQNGVIKEEEYKNQMKNIIN